MQRVQKSPLFFSLLVLHRCIPVTVKRSRENFSAWHIPCCSNRIVMKGGSKRQHAIVIHPAACAGTATECSACFYGDARGDFIAALAKRCRPRTAPYFNLV
jgi:hypothetical protein